MSVPWTPRPSDPWPGRRFDWTGRSMTAALLSALKDKPSGMVLCVSAVINGRHVRWSTRTLRIPCAAVQGGLLAFDGRLVGDASYNGTLKLDARMMELGSFDVEADNTDRFGFNVDDSEGGVAGQYVVPLAGGSAEISIAHVDVDWKDRSVRVLGSISGARYGPYGQTVSFSVTPKWKNMARLAMPTISEETWPGSGDEVSGKPYPLAVGHKENHRAVRVYEAGTSKYIVNGIAIGTQVESVSDTEGNALTLVAQPLRERDALGNMVEVVQVNSSDPEVLVHVRTNLNGFFNWLGTQSSSSGEPASVGDLIQWMIARLAGVSGEDVDLAGSNVYRWLYYHRYGMSVDDGSAIKDLLEDRVVQQAYGYISFRGGKYGFTPFPLMDVPGAPAISGRYHLGRQLLTGGAVQEGDDADLVNDYQGDFSYDNLYGGYSNAELRFSNRVGPDSSFWLRVSHYLFGPAGGEILEYPDLLRWHDVRAVMRLDERVRALVLRSTSYDCLPEVLASDIGEVVAISDDNNGWDAKTFLVTGQSVTTRPVVVMELLEWPTATDFFGVWGLGTGPPNPTSLQGNPIG